MEQEQDGIPKQFQNKSEEFDDSYLYVIPKPEIRSGDVAIPYEKMKSPIVYISLGSILSDKSFYRKCIKAFGGKEVSVILNTGKVSPDSLGEIPENIYAYSFVPQTEVLSHTDVFLTHCGMNSILMLTAAGTCILILVIGIRLLRSISVFIFMILCLMAIIE